MKLKLKSKIIPVGIIASIAAFMLMFAKEGHNTLNISAIKGNLKDMNGIYAELEGTNGKHSKVKYAIGKNGVVSKVELLKQSSDTQDAIITKVGKDPHDMIAYVGLYQEFPEVSSTTDDFVNKLVILKAKNEKYIPEKNMNVAESENQTSIAEIDSTKYEKTMINLNRSIKSGKVKNPMEELGEGFNPSLNYAFRKDGNIFAFISYVMDDSSTQFEVLKINPETLDVTTESKFNYKGVGADGMSIYDTFMDNGKIVYLAEDYNPENEKEERVVFLKYDLAKKNYSSVERTDFKLGDSFGYSINNGMLSLRNVLSYKDGKKLDEYLINSFDVDLETMAIKNYSEHKTNNKTTDYDFPIKSIYIDGKNLVYIISETYLTNPNEPTISGVSSPVLFRILDRDSGKMKFEGKVTNTGTNYTNNVDFKLKGDGYNE
ncbi:hypothetical protein [Peptacetobacter hiranonis]|uniref:Uncharacterized protein n=1 Tax=Peptacetobacter hiranonis (strain DSM 13275 / JCM 10541 / KCTC 15199 / TO-931) TaxID=500633 RepID=B6FXI0_PEPHT|nr:hypothetical protein [Peptacetobacter hiranonis]EEA85765.1 hypothetical protein CLOHIR_00579 [Peptacetobacter hiranonis DSM 13275]QEK20617.1 hypothetical protein KGNDJEFE_01100 [Peptacetobacter hiranonis]